MKRRSFVMTALATVVSLFSFKAAALATPSPLDSWVVLRYRHDDLAYAGVRRWTVIDWMDIKKGDFLMLVPREGHGLEWYRTGSDAFLNAQGVKAFEIEYYYKETGPVIWVGNNYNRPCLPPMEDNS